MIFLIALVLIIIVGAFIARANIKTGAQRFAALGTVTGRTAADIIAVVGPPNAISAMGDGSELYQWMRTNQAGGYHVCLLFRAGICEGITHVQSS